MKAADQSTLVRLDLSQTEVLLPRLWASRVVDDYYLSATLGARRDRAGFTTHSVVGVGHGLLEMRAQIGASGDAESGRAALDTPDTAWVLVMHDGEESTCCEPAGYAAFTPEVMARDGTVVALRLVLHLAWVDPRIRGSGWGVHLVANLASYFQDNGPDVPARASARGSPTTVTMSMQTPENRATRLLDYLRHAFKPRICRNWNAKSILIEPA